MHLRATHFNYVYCTLCTGWLLPKGTTTGVEVSSEQGSLGRQQIDVIGCNRLTWWLSVIIHTLMYGELIFTISHCVPPDKTDSFVRVQEVSSSCPVCVVACNRTVLIATSTFS